MDDYADIYYVDTRNADTRHGTPVQSGSGGRVQAQPARTVYVQPTGAQRPQAFQGQPMIITTQVPPTGGLGTLFGRLTTGQVIDMVAQLFAMLQPLPAAPVATKNAATDIENSILYQQAIASYAKRDEQVRTLGSLVARLVG